MIYLACSIISLLGIGFTCGIAAMAWFDDQLEEPRS